jgi:hypothetical protein
VETAFKKYLRIVCVLAIAGAGGICVLNWLVDPLQFYRKASYSPYLIPQKRFQSPGLAKHYDYDTILVGTSLSENFRRQSLKEKLSVNALNLAMQGASAREQHLIAQVALNTGRVKNVIWELNYEYLRGSTNWVANYDGSFPEYFYDQNPLNEINHYLLNLDTMKGTLKVLLKRMGLNTYRDRDLETMYSWENKRRFGTQSVERAWNRANKNRAVFEKRIPEFAAANLNASFDANILAIIRAHPDVKFYLYFPPYSVGHYAFMKTIDSSIFEHMLENKRHIFEATRGFANVQLHDFQNLSNVIADTSSYCDLVHFNGKVNEYILESLRDRRHLAGAKDAEGLRLALNDEAISDWMEKTLHPSSGTSAIKN